MRTIEIERLDISDGDTVLDLGCGEGRHLHALYYAKRLHAVGIDLGYADMLKARQALEQYPDLESNPQRICSLAQASALALPFPDGCFDVVLCSEVLEHIPDYQSALDEVRRVLKPGGTLAVSVPRTWPEWICWQLSPGGYANSPGGHIRIFRSGVLRRDIERRGMRFTRRHWAHGLHSPYWWLQCALWDRKETSRLVRLYRRFLEWDILQRPVLTRLLDKLTSPVMGKSVVMYFARVK
ncbi:MAG: class I SAM-dependent methyltransferase [Pseudomonadota bacterium]